MTGSANQFDAHAVLPELVRASTYEGCIEKLGEYDTRLANRRHSSGR